MPQWFDEINQALPPIRNEDYRNESDFYGATEEIAKSLGLGWVPEAWATWAHGWRYAETRFTEYYTWNHAPSREVLLVLRDDEKDLLQANGYASTFAVGAPFLYATPVPIPRLEDSLLIMPIHSLDYAHSQIDQAAYFEALDPQLSKFKHVAACVHPSCIRKGDWVKLLAERGIPYFHGVEIRDRNGLARMRSMMGAFSHVSSNWLGSHIPYAAYCGCHVSIYGPRPQMSVDDHRDDPFYHANPHVMDWFYGLVQAGHFERQYSEFFREPDTDADDREWAGAQLGAEHKRTPLEIAHLFRWMVDLQPGMDVAEFAKWAPRLGWRSELEGRAPQMWERLMELEAATERDRVRIETLEARIVEMNRAVEHRIRQKEEALRSRVQTIGELRKTLKGRNGTLAALQEERDRLKAALGVERR